MGRFVWPRNADGLPVKMAELCREDRAQVAAEAAESMRQWRASPEMAKAMSRPGPPPVPFHFHSVN